MAFFKTALLPFLITFLILVNFITYNMYIQKIDSLEHRRITHAIDYASEYAIYSVSKYASDKFDMTSKTVNFELAYKSYVTMIGKNMGIEIVNDKMLIDTAVQYCPVFGLVLDDGYYLTSVNDLGFHPTMFKRFLPKDLRDATVNDYNVSLPTKPITSYLLLSKTISSSVLYEDPNNPVSSKVMPDDMYNEMMVSYTTAIMKELNERIKEVTPNTEFGIYVPYFTTDSTIDGRNNIMAMQVISYIDNSLIGKGFASIAGERIIEEPQTMYVCLRRYVLPSNNSILDANKDIPTTTKGVHFKRVYIASKDLNRLMGGKYNYTANGFYDGGDGNNFNWHIKDEKGDKYICYSVPEMVLSSEDACIREGYVKDVMPFKLYKEYKDNNFNANTNPTDGVN